MEYAIFSKALKQKPYQQYACFILISGILLLSILIPPFYKGGFTVCLFKNIFGIPSPGCGMTRAFLFLGHGHIYEAIRLNPNSHIAFSIVVFLWFNTVVKIFAGKEVMIKLTQREKFLVYFVSIGLMVTGWFYNLFYNPYV